MQVISNKFPISHEEYEELDKEFGKLLHFQAWGLKKKNAKNNFPEDQEDIAQDLRIALLRAGSYYKRQTYITDSFFVLKKYVKDRFLRLMLNELQNLWSKRTRHGANRQKFGEYQELILEQLIEKHVPSDKKPQKSRPLIMNKEFSGYCKSITWNELKLAGKKITKEKPIRTGLVSLSEYDYLVRN